VFLGILASANAGVLFGGAWVPTGIGALSWTEDDQLSGTLAGEFDGWLRPPLTAHGGWVGRTDALLASVAWVRFTTGSYGEDGRRDTVGSLRLGADWRRYVFAREAGRVDLYGQVGGHGIVPTAILVDESFTSAEQQDADATSADTRQRIGGVGAQAGLGADYLFADARGRPAVGLGLRYLVRVYRGQEVGETTVTVSTAVLTEAALVLEFVR